jgi:hypothetical protein
MSGDKHPRFDISPSIEAREKQSIALMGKKKSEITKKRMSKPKTKSHAENISKSRIGIVFGEVQKNKISKGASKYNFIFISPTGTIYEHYSMPQFCKEHDLCPQLGYDMMNKGIIPTSNRKNLSSKRINISGWEIKATPK